jgi:hypothetical protein
MSVFQLDERATRLSAIVGTALLFCVLPCLAQNAVSEQQALPEGMILNTPFIPKNVVGSMRSLNETLSRDLAPCDNAAVFLVQVLGDHIIRPEVRRDTLEMLGIETLSKMSPHFFALEEYIQAEGKVRPERAQGAVLELQGALYAASERPWKAEEYVDVGDYLKANQAGLNAVVALSNKPRYFAPMLALEEPQRLMSASFAIEYRLPFVVRCLTARAMFRIANDDLSGTMTDILACHQLAKLLADGSPCDVSAGRANLINSFAYRGEVALLESGKLTASQVTAFRQQLEKIPVQINAARAADIGERAILHQEIELLQADKAAMQEFFTVANQKDLPPVEKRPIPAVKWDLVLKRADLIQDQIVQALGTRDRKEQSDKFVQLDQLYAKWQTASDANTLRFAEAKVGDIDAASEWIGETMAMSLFPVYRQRRATEDLAVIRRELIVVGLSLVLYQREQGEYPSGLSDLVPKYLSAVPQDDAVLSYVRDAKDQCHVISLGVNRHHDAGRFDNDDHRIELKAKP